MKAVRIPVDPARPIDLVEVSNHFRSLAAAIGGPCEYIERVACPLTRDHHLVVVVDENGMFNGQPANPRAWPLYPVPGYHLHGTVLVLTEEMTQDGLDFVDLLNPESTLHLIERTLNVSA